MNTAASLLKNLWPPLLAALTAAVLTACAAGDAVQPSQVSVVHWPQRQLLLVGHGGSGDLKVFRLIGERPVPVGEWRAPGRGRVLELRLDAARDGVWVRGESSLDLHAAPRARCWSAARPPPTPRRSLPPPGRPSPCIECRRRHGAAAR